ncbi:LysR family transcriptional regulator [Aristophania vespae]|uniref:LysR family transcriptional regulator n=1 Tax=Aristophania vespae TaxID=2697033 RepID=A0A6P1NFP9_9PROT|nr:LysR family transcriptional regulator [Aristophania vespae]QHI95737.1 LysR family transcriptional regulator [Aristophania vespae]UMM63433.1 Hca operon transcriptional activator HcaR [Aristophania vespae]
MDIRHFKYFIAVADAGSITLAANRLGMEQPPLSQQLRKLEENLGVSLFIRQTRGVALTEAGRMLLPQARLLLELREQFIENAKSLAEGKKGHLRIGLAGSVPLLPAIPYAIRQFSSMAPDVILSLEESNTPALCNALVNYKIDIAVIRPPVIQAELIDVIPLFNEPTLIALPHGHRFSHYEKIHLKDMANDPLIIFPRELGPGLYDSIVAAYQHAGVTPPLGQQAPQVAGTIPLVAAGLGVSVVPRSLQQLHAGGVTYHEIAEPAPYANLAIGVRKKQNRPLVQHFSKLLKDICTNYTL